MRIAKLGAMKMLEKVCTLIRTKGLTQREVEAQLGFAENRISKWVNGTGEPKAHQVWLMARALGVSVEYLLNDELVDPSNETGLSEDERHILRTVRAIGLTADEFSRRIYGKNVVPADRSPAVGHAVKKAPPAVKRRKQTG